MQAVVFHDIGDIRLEDVPEPKLKDDTDAIVRITASAICGTDLHFIRRTMPGVKKGRILGHEAVGVVGSSAKKSGTFAKATASSWARPSAAATARTAAPAISRNAITPIRSASVPGGFSLAGRRRRVAPKQDPQRQNWHPGDGPSQALRWGVEVLAKAGTHGIIGVYPKAASFYPVTQAMGKNLAMKAGDCNHRRYIPKLVDLVATGMIAPTAIITQVEPMSDVISAYEAFDRREAGWIKVELKPRTGGMQRTAA